MDVYVKKTNIMTISWTSVIHVGCGDKWWLSKCNLKFHDQVFVVRKMSKSKTPNVLHILTNYIHTTIQIDLFIKVDSQKHLK